MANIKKKVGRTVCKYIKLNDNAEYDKDNYIVKVTINGIIYKSCALCNIFYVVGGRNTKYCPDCRDKANSLKTSERYKEKQFTKV
jgi:hypothetical protein